jgi:pimeloyl-ACP methyl ester carboxylesterase
MEPLIFEQSHPYEFDPQYLAKLFEHGSRRREPDICRAKVLRDFDGGPDPGIGEMDPGLRPAFNWEKSRSLVDEAKQTEEKTTLPLASANGIEIFYDDVGDPNAPALLLIMGLATQMIGWPEAFCGRLADRGFRVIRFDNRDIGLTTKIENAPKVDIRAAFLRALAGQPVRAPYNLDDMARDAIGLLDALGVARAHVVGASMGGMIAQIMAAKHSARTRSLVSMMSTSGDPKLPQAKPAVAAMVTATRPPGSDREASIQFGMNVYRVIGSPGYPTPEPELRAKVERAFDRSYNTAGVGRQMLAIVASGSRVDLLKTIRAPTLVLHGEDDPLVPVEGGRDTARLTPGATLKIIPGWGHDVPTALIPTLVEAIAAHCQNADRAAAA